MSNKWAYYNEIDPFAAQWLRNLMSAGLIAQGVVDERSISDVKPAEIQEFTQCHFFAGIGVWSYALRSAGWHDHRPVWTGSCPCQPFSSAGKGNGFLDERHLWPHWFHLIQMCRPIEIFGEQVASKDGLAWLDTVQTDLEESGYTNAALDLCAAGFGAPHIRQRLWLYARRRIANAASRGREWYSSGSEIEAGYQERPTENWELQNRPEGSAVLNLQQASLSQLANTSSIGCEGKRREGQEGIAKHSQTNLLADAMRKYGSEPDEPAEIRGWQNNTEQARLGGGSYSVEIITNSEREQLAWCLHRLEEDRKEKGSRKTTEPSGYGETNGFWSDSNWIYCRDGKCRPIEPSTFPLVNVPSTRVVRESTDPETVRNHPKIRKGALKGYGNAIVAEVAKEFIKAAMQYKP